MYIIPDNAQHIGGREQQEDSFGFSAFDQEDLIQKRGYLAIVADGMGGMTAGREASGIAVQAFLQYYQDLSVKGSIPHLLRASVLYANEMVCRFAESVGLEDMVGTTLVAAVIKEHHLYWISVGDSRIYLFRNQELIQLTEDHVYENELLEGVARGKLSKEDVEEDPQKDALTSYVGLQALSDLDVNVKPFPLEAGDRILLCSDGVYGYLSEREMIESLKESRKDVCQSIIQKVLAQAHPYQDNATVAILNVHEEAVLAPVQLMEGTQRNHPVPSRKKKILQLMLTFLVLVIVCGGGYFGYVSWVGTDKYKDWIPDKWDFFNQEKEKKEGEN
ncbi:protein phosphatase [Bacillus tianshenii]|uniref:Protein phosphatase n=1 Tax=Sutcliffiella tianshenii TaxID=1463404 RepID=A0ABS2P2R3_9BACI|nr:protein phosphatase 2C domain-containing protein [Bacillus tianshenii]MBM7621252.1 protein phosphatase [Bacillus tianshenii]